MIARPESRIRPVLAFLAAGAASIDSPRGRSRHREHRCDVRGACATATSALPDRRPTSTRRGPGASRPTRRSAPIHFRRRRGERLLSTTQAPPDVVALDATTGDFVMHRLDMQALRSFARISPPAWASVATQQRHRLRHPSSLIASTQDRARVRVRRTGHVDLRLDDDQARTWNGRPRAHSPPRIARRERLARAFDRNAEERQRQGYVRATTPPSAALDLSHHPAPVSSLRDWLNDSASYTEHRRLGDVL